MTYLEILIALHDNCVDCISLVDKDIYSFQATHLALALRRNSSIKSAVFLNILFCPLVLSILIDALSAHPKLQNLIIDNCNILPKDIQLLVEKLCHNHIVSDLSLYDNKLSDKAAWSLSMLLEASTHLQHLNLNENEITYLGANFLGRALKQNLTLTCLRLDHNPLGDEGVGALGIALAYNLTLRVLSLKENKLTCMGATILGWMLKNNSHLIELDLCHNSIGYLGAVFLAEGLQNNPCLLKLNLNHNTIGLAGSLMLARALKMNQHLTTLGIADNHIGDEGAMALCKALASNRSLRKLNLRHNKLTDYTGVVLNQVLAINHSLQHVYIDGNQLSKPYLKFISSTLYKNRRKISSPPLIDYDSNDYLNLKTHRAFWHEACQLLIAERLFAQANRSGLNWLSFLPLELQSYILDCLDNKRQLTFWQRNNIARYAKARPQPGKTRNEFLCYTFFYQKPLKALNTFQSPILRQMGSLEKQVTSFLHHQRRNSI